MTKKQKKDLQDKTRQEIIRDIYEIIDNKNIVYVDIHCPLINLQVTVKKLKW